MASTFSLLWKLAEVLVRTYYIGGPKLSSGQPVGLWVTSLIMSIETIPRALSPQWANRWRALRIPDDADRRSGIMPITHSD